jgi:AICAR transformylase/IMP cyclohydrolase PurH
MQQHKIKGIDLVVVNLYPFRQTVAKPGVTLDEAVENIDIGGPAMIRAAAKNFSYVAVVVNPDKYAKIADELTNKGELSLEMRMDLAREAYSHTAEYDAYIARYLGEQLGLGMFPDKLQLFFDKIQDLRYGETPTSERPSTASPALTGRVWAARTSCTARSYPSTILSTSKPPSILSTSSPSRRPPSSSIPIPAARGRGRA